MTEPSYISTKKINAPISGGKGNFVMNATHDAQTDDHARRTAYALGELSGSSAQQVERELTDDEQARQDVDATRQLADKLSAALQREPGAELTPLQRQRILAAAQRSARAWWRKPWLAAACLTLAAGGVWALLPTLGEARRTTRVSTQQLALDQSQLDGVLENNRVSDANYRSGGYTAKPDETAQNQKQSAAITPAPTSTTTSSAATSHSDSNHSWRGTQNGEPISQLVRQRGQYRLQNAETATPTSTTTPAPAGGSAGNTSNRPHPSVSESYEWRGNLGRNNNPVQSEPTNYFVDAQSVIVTSEAAAPAAKPAPETLGVTLQGQTLNVITPTPAPVNINKEAEAQAHATHPGFNTEAYDRLVDNPFLRVSDQPLSTFSIDVDTASYANTRRFLLEQHQLPPRDAVRIEEMINYFSYDYSPPADREAPFAAHVEVSDCPWNTQHRLVRVGLKGYELPAAERPASNLVFLIDVSGSMRPANKLPLLKQALRMLVDQLDERDRVALAVYAGASGLVLDSTAVTDPQVFHHALENLQAGGSTNGGAGIELAYQVAAKNFVKGGINRVILCTDGDFNVGVTDRGALTRLIEEKRQIGVFLSLLGFGMGNLKDATMEELSNKGNGNYAYIDSLAEARKVLVEQMAGTLITIAKDVKIQVEFNPAQAQAYRLIGYENRLLAKEDFNDDTKDAGEIGAGHTVTALYEVVPAAADVANPAGVAPAVDPLRYQPAAPVERLAHADELLTLKLRYKQPDGDTSQLIEFPVTDPHRPLAQATNDFHFAAAVAAFGLTLRHSPHRGQANCALALDLAQGALGEDPHGYRQQFIQLVTAAQALLARQEAQPANQP